MWHYWKKIECYWKWKISEKYFYFIYCFYSCLSYTTNQMGRYYFSLMHRQHVLSGTKKHSTMTDVGVCVRACVYCGIKLAHLQVEFRVKLSLSHTWTTSTLICHPGGQFGCLALKSQKITQRNPDKHITTVNWWKNSLKRGVFKWWLSLNDKSCKKMFLSQKYSQIKHY